MKLAPRHRRILIAALLMLALSAAAWVSEPGNTGKPEVVEAPARSARPVTTATLPKEPPSIHLQKLQSRAAASKTDDAFPPHTWRKAVPVTPPPVAQTVVAAPPPPPVVAVAVAPTPPAPAPPPLPPPTAPPLPFVYLGKIQSEEANAFFLGLDQRTLIVHAGDVIDALYRVDAMNEGGMTFTHLPTGIQQNLPIGAPK